MLGLGRDHWLGLKSIFLRVSRNDALQHKPTFRKCSHLNTFPLQTLLGCVNARKCSHVSRLCGWEEFMVSPNAEFRSLLESVVKYNITGTPRRKEPWISWDIHVLTLLGIKQKCVILSIFVLPCNFLHCKLLTL